MGRGWAGEDEGKGRGREGKGKLRGREREGPQVTVEPGPLTAWLRHWPSTLSFDPSGLIQQHLPAVFISPNA